MFHDLTWTFGQQETLDRDHIKERSGSLDADAECFVEILKANTSISGADLDSLKLFKQSSIVKASRAKEVGIVQDVTDAKIPVGEVVLNVDF